MFVFPRLRRLLFAALALALLARSGAAQSPAIRRLADDLRADAAADSVGSIAAAVVVGDQVVWADAFGWKDRAARAPADAHTIYRIGSISKSITAVALMRLVERGIVDLDAPVERYLPEIRELAHYPTDHPITVRQLASHTAGLSREPRLPHAAEGPIAEWQRKVLESIPTTSVETPPGTRYHYSNIGYGILGLMLARASATPYLRLVEESVFRPLKMRRTTFIVSDALRRDLATGYVNRPDGTVDPTLPMREHAGRGYKVPNGGVYTDARDLARFVAAMTGAVHLLADSTRAEMLQVQTPEHPNDGYGLGFFVTVDSTGHRIAGHGGSVAGYSAVIEFDPDARVGVVLLRNYNRGRTQPQRLVEAVREVRAELKR